MRCSFRILLTWLIALALPVQGWAASTMSVCGPSHSRMVAAAVDAHAHHGMAHVDADAPPADLSCSACAWCCSLLALPAAAAFEAADELRAPALPMAAAAQAVFLTEGQERPPRTAVR